VFAPARGVENPIVRRAVELCDQAGMKIIYHEDAVEVWFSPDKKRFYTTWNQFLTDTEKLFGERMQEPPEAEAPARVLFGHRAPSAEPTAVNGHTNGHAQLNEHAEIVAPESAASPDAAAQAEIKRLRAEVKLLERAIKVVGMQSEEWKRETERARQETETARAEVAMMVEARVALAAQGPDRYKMLRQIIVKRLHPDISSSPEERVYREKMFKSIWQDIEAIDKKA
jgi:hypothetical protein